MRRFAFLMSFLALAFIATASSSISISSNTIQMGKKLKHIVLIEFKEGTSVQDIEKVKKAAMKLSEINGVHELAFSENVSPENLNKNYTHALTMWFKTEEDRDKGYLPHPIHQEFVNFFVPLTNSVLVFDYWEEE